MSIPSYNQIVKAVVDIEREIMAVDATLHSDLERLLLEDGSSQNHLWGINFHPKLTGDDFVEFDSMINLRPSDGNLSRGVDDPTKQLLILDVVGKLVVE